MLRLIDTHSHIYEPEFDDDRNEVVERAIAAGVDRMLLPAIDTQSHSRMIELTKAHPSPQRVPKSRATITTGTMDAMVTDPPCAQNLKGAKRLST